MKGLSIKSDSERVCPDVTTHPSPPATNSIGEKLEDSLAGLRIDGTTHGEKIGISREESGRRVGGSGG